MQEDTSLPVKGPVKRNQGASWGVGGGCFCRRQRGQTAMTPPQTLGKDGLPVASLPTCSLNKHWVSTTSHECATWARSICEEGSGADI